MRSKDRYRPVKPFDVLIIILFLLSIFFIPHEIGSKVKITVDKRKEFIYPLNRDMILNVEGKIGITTIAISDNKVRVLKAPCPLKLCKKKGWIKNKGQQIICVPNRIHIQIQGETLDGITE